MRRDLAAWLSHIEKLHNPNFINLGLERILPIAAKLQLTDFPYKVITVTGTNGKGSCVAFLESIAKEAGLKAAAYTSPHLLRFNERIRVNGKNIDDKTLCKAFEVIEEVSIGCELTYFEYTTLAALHIFRNKALDLLILEVGLGGRLDATNVVNSDIAIITTISIEHTQYLGNTREKIAYEKAGIMRSGKPVICGDLNPPNNLRDFASKIGAPFYSIYDEKETKAFMAQQCSEIALPKPSAACAMLAVRLLPFYITPKQISEAIKTTTLLGRWQKFSEPCETIIDVAHNPEAALYLAGKLAGEPQKQTTAVVGILNDKDIKGVLSPLVPYVSDWYAAALATERSSSALQIKTALQQLGVESCHICSSVEDAYNRAVKVCSKESRILCYGSFYVVGEILKVLNFKLL